MVALQVFTVVMAMVAGQEGGLPQRRVDDPTYTAANVKSLREAMRTAATKCLERHSGDGEHADYQKAYLAVLAEGICVARGGKRLQATNVEFAGELEDREREEWLRHSMEHAGDRDKRGALREAIATVKKPKYFSVPSMQEVCEVVFNLTKDAERRALVQAEWDRIERAEYNSAVAHYEKLKSQRASGVRVQTGEPPRLQAMPVWDVAKRIAAPETPAP